MADFHNKPCAASGLKSYRYDGPFGFVMIGAKNEDDALHEASRSINGDPDFDRLYHWVESEGCYMHWRDALQYGVTE